jgi:hypothetical protein
MLKIHKSRSQAKPTMIPRLSFDPGGDWFLRTPAVARKPLQPAAPAPTPADWVRHNLAFSPDPIQEAILNSPAHRLLLCCSRQWGKSTVTAFKALHFALHHPNQLILVASRTYPQSAEWLAKVKSALRRLQIPFRTDRIHRYSVVLPNLSRIVCLADVADNVVGISAPNLIVIDEAARVSEDLIVALTPMLATSNGRLWALSTPFKQAGFFYDAWRHTAGPWTRFLVTAEDCPRISPDFLAETKILIGENKYRREFLCEFKAGDHQIITRELIERAFRPGPLFNEGKPIWKG